MALRFEEYVFKAEDFVREVARYVNAPDVDNARHATIAVLYTLRELLTVEDSLHLIAQLPLYLKATYAYQWKIPAGPTVPSMDLLQNFQSHYETLAGFSLPRELATRYVVAVFAAMKKYVHAGDFAKIAFRLPALLREELMLWRAQSLDIPGTKAKF